MPPRLSRYPTDQRIQVEPTHIVLGEFEQALAPLEKTVEKHRPKSVQPKFGTKVYPCAPARASGTSYAALISLPGCAYGETDPRCASREPTNTFVKDCCRFSTLLLISRLMFTYRGQGRLNLWQKPDQS